MGTQLVEHVLKHSKAASGARTVLIVLAHRANSETGVCRITIGELAALCAVSTRQIYHDLKHLESIGSIQRLRRKGKSSLYRINQIPEGLI